MDEEGWIDFRRGAVRGWMPCRYADVVPVRGVSAPKWRQEGDILGFVADGKDSAYEITFE